MTFKLNSVKFKKDTKFKERQQEKEIREKDEEDMR